MYTNWKTKTIGDIVTHLPEAADLFQSKRIDYCCGGQRLLSDALREQDIGENEIYAALDRAQDKQEQRNFMTDFSAMPPQDLAGYIEGQHHVYLREALPKIGEVFAVVLKAHGANHPSLFKAHSLFGRLRTDLEQHLVKEEAFLFPQLDEEITRETIRLAREIVAEHEAAGAVLKQMRSLTCNYTAPCGVCRTYESLLAQLEDLESDLFRHIHLENNILLKDIIS